MRLFLIRHAESVDNVAGLYAGSRDSPLTSHGVLQTTRLGSHLAARKDVHLISHIFTSNLQRAVITAEAVAAARKKKAEEKGVTEIIKVQQLPELREKDFGAGEGVSYRIRDKTAGSFVGIEGKESMLLRSNRFIDTYLLPALAEAVSSENEAIVIVAHGLILNVLYERLRTRFGEGITSTSASWSNTGYLEATLEQLPTPTPTSTSDVPTPTLLTSSQAAGKPSLVVVPPLATATWRFKVLSVNQVDHLKGLRKTRGGIGSAQFDSKQRKMDSFFQPTAKKRKADDSSKP